MTAAGSIAARLDDVRRRLGAPVDGASLAALRVAFGLVMTAAVARFWAMGWIDALYVAPRFHFHYWGFEWVRPLPAPWIYVHFAVLAACAALVAVGLFYRVAIVAFVVLFAWVELLDAATYLNHYYAISLVGVLLAVTPAHRVASLDAWRAARRGAPLPCVVPAGALWALRAQLGLVYFFAGLAKLGSDWLFRAEPLRTWLLSRSDFPVLGPLFELEETAFAMSWAGALFDLSVPFLLWWRRTRPPAYGAVIAFHALTGALFPIGMFPWVMVLLTPIFFEPDWPRRAWRALALRRPSSVRVEPVASGPGAEPAPLSRRASLALAAWLAVQIALPLRHHLYPGDVLWTHEGMRWAWHVMIAERGAVAELRATDATGRRWIVDPRATLTPAQYATMAAEPELLLEFAHHVRDELAARGHHVQVHADVFVALNGRPSRRLVDPGVDLGAEPSSMWGYSWILRHELAGTDEKH